MKARIRATGDIYNVMDMNDYRNRFKLEDNNWYTMGEIELIEGNEPDWQHYRIQAAIAAMNIVKGAYNIHNDMERLVRHSVKLADALIAELQKKGGKNETAK